AAPLDFGARRACVCVRIGGKTISRQAPDDCELSAVQELGSVQKSPGKNSAIKHRLEEVVAPSRCAPDKFALLKVVPRRSAIVSFLNPQPALSLVGGNRSSCPITVVQGADSRAVRA